MLSVILLNAVIQHNNILQIFTILTFSITTLSIMTWHSGKRHQHNGNQHNDNLQNELNFSTQYNIPYFIKYNAYTSIVRNWISQWFLATKVFLFFKNTFTRINHCKFIHHKSHIKPFLSYLPCIVRREYFSIIFYLKKCALYLIKYGILLEWECHYMECQ